MESVCRGNSTVGSNPTLSATPIVGPSNRTIYIRATECYIFPTNCTGLHSLAARRLPSPGSFFPRTGCQTSLAGCKSFGMVCRVPRIFSKCNRLSCGRKPCSQRPVRAAASVLLIEVFAHFRIFLRRHSLNFTNKDFGDFREQKSLVPLFMRTDNRFGDFDVFGHIRLLLTLHHRRYQMRAEPNPEVPRQALHRMAVLVDRQRRQALTNFLL